jgi:hypothetical protein
MLVHSVYGDVEYGCAKWVFGEQILKEWGFRVGEFKA